ncbi:DUF2393 family protein [uncultured Campylobacter sp.]|uniref:DUF2393 family protein n=1 Tax=uncultured Campylobacter sp. TaxID=218934 RepID=UPI00261BB328|nr:DUF2393 family protein [uncultured Campylobacter sp.]
MAFTIFHIIVLIASILVFTSLCVLVFLKIKDIKSALTAYATSFMGVAIIAYSLFITIDGYIVQAEVSNVNFSRNLSSETVTVRGRITNKTKFPIRKCFLQVTIVNKVGSSGDIFANQPQIKTSKGVSNKASYNLLIANSLNGNSYEDFSIQIPFPPGFGRAEFYHNLKCI